MGARPVLRVAGAAVLGSLALATAAHAGVYCAPAPCSEGTPLPTSQAAIDAADSAPGADTVAIKAGRFDVETGQQGLKVAAQSTDVHGAGIGKTVLTAEPLPSSADYSLVLISGFMAHLSDLTLQLPSDDTPGHDSSVVGAEMLTGTAQRVHVNAAKGATFGAGPSDGRAVGLLLNHGIARLSSIALSTRSDTIGLQASGPSRARGLTISALRGVVSDVQATPTAQTATMSRLRVSAQQPLNVTDGFLRLADSLLDARRAQGTFPISAVQIHPTRGPRPAGLTADRVTIAGSGRDTQAAFELGSTEDSRPAKTTLLGRHLSVGGFGRTVVRNRFGGDITIDVSNSVILGTPGWIYDAGSGGEMSTKFGPGVRGREDPLFFQPDRGDFRPMGGSAMIDIRGSDLIPGGPTDLAGAARPRDGDGDGKAQNDAGAFEYQPDHRRPSITGLTVTPSSFHAGSGVTFRYSLSEACNVRLRLQRRRSGHWETVFRILRQQGPGKQVVPFERAALLERGRWRVDAIATDIGANDSESARKGFEVE